MRIQSLLLLSLVMTPACEDATTPTSAPPSPYACDASAPPSRTISCVESFEPGEGAGFGSTRFPEVIFGKPVGSGDTAGSLDVLSLGKFGTITVGFDGNTIVDGPGVDFTVFENPFFMGGNPANVFHEWAEISVSADGQTWSTITCHDDIDPPLGCAGQTPVYANADVNEVTFDPTQSGGDSFDLAETGLSEARFVRIRDIEGKGGAPSAGFDLDAVAIIHAQFP